MTAIANRTSQMVNLTSLANEVGISVPTAEHVENFSVLDKIKGINVGTGCVVCMYDKCVHINDKNVTIPVTWL